MQTFTFDCEVDKHRGVVLRLPPSVSPDRHRLAVTIDPPEIVLAPTQSAPIAPIDESTAPRTDLWRQLEALRAQAAQTGDLPDPMAWGTVPAEAERRRGERDD